MKKAAIASLPENRAPITIKETAQRVAYLTKSAVQWIVDPQCIAAAARCPSTGQSINWTKTIGLKHQSLAVRADVECAAQHSAAQRSTAQRSTAQHSTAQHSTAQHSTASVLPCESERNSDDRVTHVCNHHYCNQCCGVNCLLSR